MAQVPFSPTAIVERVPITKEDVGEIAYVLPEAEVAISKEAMKLPISDSPTV
jgi:hypothetical protein